MAKSGTLVIDIKRWNPEITDDDLQRYMSIVTFDLTAEQRERIETPKAVYAMQDSVLALHWHPEFVPMECIRTRIEATFPNSNLELIIPTQHNQLVSYDDYTGVEIDTYSKGFNLKVQLLAHFSKDRLSDAGVFKDMLAYTFKYRSSQLEEFIDSVLEPGYQERVNEAAAKTGAEDTLVNFVRNGVTKLKKLMEIKFSETPEFMRRNKIIQLYFDSLRGEYGDSHIDRAQVFLKAVKKIVKRRFSPTHFYETEEMIAEIRSLGGCIVVPHPEQFWPILLADYDVDAYEVWNPQSLEYTDFLINVVSRQNSRRLAGERPLLITMGDDCHMGEKTKPVHRQNLAKASREIGVQPAWEDLQVKKSLILAGMDRRKTIEEYKSRLG